MPSRSTFVMAVLVGASLTLAPVPSLAGPGPTEQPAEDLSQPTNPAQPDADPPPTRGIVLPPPTLDPNNLPQPESEPGIEFAVPPPESEPEPDEPTDVVPGYIAEFPDPGHAPNDGHSTLALSGTTLILAGIGFGVGLTVGLRRSVPLEWLLPSTIVPTVGVLAFSAGGLYQGIKLAQTYRRWEIGHRVIGSPQGGGLRVGGSFALLGAIGFISSGAFALRDRQLEFGGTMLAIGCAAAVATPIMFVVGAVYQRDYERTGGWRRRPVPPLPPGAEGAQLQLMPMVVPLPGGVGLGAAGRF
ncbi:hypothetical protein DB30_00709 [Enhygromyxa salina]|uniref:Uncharacterized protein n=1 Tax=Enhygromyxa salina TaxID=215803 RepID=A0A0C1ZLL9_9BACT|nr:hypothetical protein [Enhygromyxa salina]KIG18424.1 hypothetical protein DB30_00709 [Enhygromyxa salina]